MLDEPQGGAVEERHAGHVHHGIRAEGCVYITETPLHLTGHIAANVLVEHRGAISKRGFNVTRPSLEDIYLRLTQSPESEEVPR